MKVPSTEINIFLGVYLKIWRQKVEVELFFLGDQFWQSNVRFWTLQYDKRTSCTRATAPDLNAAAIHFGKLLRNAIIELALIVANSYYFSTKRTILVRS